MKFQIYAALAAVTVATTLPLSARAGDDGAGCSNQTLRGAYAFVVSGRVFTALGTVLRQGVAKTDFDGAGNLTQQDFLIQTLPSGVSSPVPTPPSDIDVTTGFHINETGTYVVNPDCTGEAVIHFPAPAGVTGAIIHLMFVLADGGRTIHTVVSTLTPPSNQPPILGASIYSNGWRIERSGDQP